MDKLLLLGEFDRDISVLKNKISLMEENIKRLEGRRLRADANLALLKNRLNTLEKGRDIVDTLCETEVLEFIEV